ncbi:hypothetical protein BSL82_08735 [Tardibacter chloracetimidivorans]|uniref:Ketoreductase domain-containing protein n=1 Tax=Tardibacter chloracetimidivorans TaxID=1921510 RepID=A0A1L3ZUQ8_9SPHN|nr:glucose 1-dehydrogenase [Tardibacter chloracetimidivorans]API59384.1 hypothetical protein BSL82_08735 [Tardibacter chloracetimidivorans]
MRLARRNALVTGAASGIGRAVAEAFAKEGARVWLADVNEEGVAALAEIIGSAASVLPLDVSDAPSVERAMSNVGADNGGIDLLVNAAGVYSLQPWLEIEPESWDRVFAVNARGVMQTTQAAGHAMIAHGRGGVIINIASAAGRRGDPNSVAYSASKAAAISISQSAAIAFAPYNIRVNAIAPGPVATPMWSDVVRLRADRGDQSAEHMAARVPLGRVSTPDEQAQVAVFLASAESSYVTGQTLNVDGGLIPS